MTRAMVLGSLCAVLLSAQSDTSTVNGRVVDAANSLGLPGALVTITATPNAPGHMPSGTSVLTGAAGSFSFLGVPAGSYSLSVERPGYGAAGLMVEATSAKIGEPIVLRLRPLAILQGAVRDENGDPLPGVNLTLLRKVISQGRGSLQPAVSAATNDLGEYRVASLEPGRYLLCWSAPASSYQLHKHLAYPMGCYPGGVPPAAARFLDLVAGQPSTVDFMVSPVPAARISGTLDGANGKTVVIGVSSLDPDALPLVPACPTRWNEKTSSFQVLGVTPGKYRITAQVFGDGVNERAVYDLDSTGQDVSGVHLTAAYGTPLTGAIRFAGDPPPPNSIGVNLTGAGYYSATAAADNTFSIPEIQPGKYELSVYAPQGWYVKSASQNGNDVWENGLSVEPGSAPAALDIELAQGGGSLEMNVPGETSARIAILTASGRRLVREVLFSGTAGSTLRVGDIPPGDYKVFAWKPEENVEYLNLEVLRQYDGYGCTVTVQDDSTANVTLKLAPPGAQP